MKSHGFENYFNKILKVNDSQISWEDLKQEIPYFPRGWFELAHLSTKDRIEFTQAFWLSKFKKLDIQKGILDKLFQFFESIEEIVVMASRELEDVSYDVHMLYQLKNQTVLHGYPPVDEEEVLQLQKMFSYMALPMDYLAFFSIHNGFSKFVDTGVISTYDLAKMRAIFENSFHEEWILVGHHLLSIKQLFPFYGGVELEEFQCFFPSWLSDEKKMQNISVYLAPEITLEVLNQTEIKKFSTFLHWLLNYMLHK